MAIQPAASGTSYSALLQARLDATARATSALNATNKSGATPVSAAKPQSAASLLKTANNSIFSMANLMQRSRSLATTANSLRTSDTAGLDNVRSQMAAMLKEFTAIGVAAGITPATETKAGAKGEAPLTLNQVRANLTDMQSSLQTSIRKIGKSSLIAINSGAFTGR